MCTIKQSVLSDYSLLNEHQNTPSTIAIEILSDKYERQNDIPPETVKKWIEDANKE